MRFPAAVALLLLLLLPLRAAAADINWQSGDRMIFISDSFMEPPTGVVGDYISSYLYMMYPTLNLRLETLARSGSSMGGWIDGSGTSNEEYSKRVYGLSPDYIFALTNTNGPANDYKPNLRTLITDHVFALNGATMIMVGAFPTASHSNSSWFSREADDVNVALYQDDNTTLRGTALIQHSTETALQTIWRQNDLTVTADGSTDTFTTSSPHGYDGTRQVYFQFNSNVTNVPLTSSNLAVFYWPVQITSTTFKISSTQGGAAIDIGSTTGTNYVSDLWPMLVYPTANYYHPSFVANAIAAYVILDGLGWSADVSSATIAANTLTVTSETQCDVASVTSNAYGGIDFTRLDNRLPMTIDASARAGAVEMYPEVETWQQYLLTVTGLSAGTYDVRINGTDVADVTHTEFAAGWNMAGLTSGPVYTKAQEVLGKIRDLHGRNRTTLAEEQNPGWNGVARWKSNASAQYVVGNGATPADRRAHMLGTSMDDARSNIAYYEGLIHTEATPETLTFSLRLQGYTPAGTASATTVNATTLNVSP